MATTIDPKKGDIVSFQFVNNSLIGGGKDQVKVDGVVGYSIARGIDPEITVKHQSLYPYFTNKVGNVDDPSIYDYIGVINTNGQLEMVGIPWILDSTFQYTSSERAIIAIPRWQERHRPAFETFMQSLGLDWTLNKFNNN